MVFTGCLLWTSEESIYVFFNANTNVLYFTDGSHWQMGCTSAGTEWDAGTMYPTLMEDTNGNEVFITYNDGVGVTWSNSSSRIATIEDVRGYGSADYTFTYNTDAIPHLTGIANTIGTAEHYSFAYNENYALNSPFGSQSYGTVVLLESSTVTGIPLTTYFTYDTTTATASCSSTGTGTSGPGQLTQVTTPYCGHLRWTYTTANTLSGSRTYNEVQNRYLSMSSGAAETEISLVRANDTAYTVHSSATLQDSPANAEKIWTFQTSTSSSYLGLETSYEELTLSTGTGLMLENFTWAQTPTSLNPYVGTTVTKLNPGQSYEADKQATQTLDQYGNALTVQAYNFGNGSVGSLARTTTNTYLYQSNSTYTSYYILNRLLTSTITDGTNTATLVSNSYDGTSGFCPQSPGQNPQGCQQPPCDVWTINGPGICEHDNANYPPTFSYRGNLSGSTTPTTTTTNQYDTFGLGTITSTTVNGVQTTVGGGNNYAAPIAVTTDGTSTLNWTQFLGLSSATGPNGDTASIGYDANARPASTTAPDGVVTQYTYNDSASPPNKIATTCLSGAGMCYGPWTESVMDGFGRTIQTVTGYSTSSANTTNSTVDTKYAPCGCSPLGKMSQQSQAYAPGGTDAWTTYAYDASGRTLTQALPDGSTTTYQYTGNSVTVTDPAGKWKAFQLDAFSNLLNVQEPDPSLGTVSTNYTYDVLNHLTSVSMPRGSSGTQTRTFNYSSGTTVTGLLQSATNPENGTVTYTYNSGTYTLASKTDAKSQQLVYQYDGDNRVTSVALQPSYTCPKPPLPCNPPSPQVIRTYYYDTNPLDTTGFSQNLTGRLAAIKYASTFGMSGNNQVQMNEMYSYYTWGGAPSAKRVQVNEPIAYYSDNQPASTTLTANLDSTYSYDYKGQLTSISYPSTGSTSAPVTGPTYTYTFDGMERPTGMGGPNKTTLVNNVTYNAMNERLTMDTTSSSPYAETETRTYNTLGQLTGINTQSLQYPVGTELNFTYNYPTGTNNGKINSSYNAVTGETITYTYDSLNRLISASGSGGATTWGQAYGFDPFGNLLSKTVTAGSGPSLSQAVNTANNQIVGQSYDANGNALYVTNAGVNYTLAYDTENHLGQVSASGNYYDYGYDAQNRRLWSWTSGTKDLYGNAINFAIMVYSPNGRRQGLYVFSTQFTTNPQTNQTTAALNVQGTPMLYFAGSLLGTPQDRLGSNVNYDGTTYDYFPWGEQKGTGNSQNGPNFATYWQDSLTGLDYAMNRYYSNAYGRFMTPDLTGNAWDPHNPQTWNLYAYALDEPVNLNDPSGLQSIPVTGGGDPNSCLNQSLNPWLQANGFNPVEPGGDLGGFLFGTSTGVLGLTLFFEDEGGSQTLYTDLAQVLLNRYELNFSNPSLVSSLGLPSSSSFISVIEASSTAWTSGQLNNSFVKQLINYLDAPASSGACSQLISAFTTANSTQGYTNGAGNITLMPGTSASISTKTYWFYLPSAPNPVQQQYWVTSTTTIDDWIFETYVGPRQVRRRPRRPVRRADDGGLLQ